MSEIRLDTVTTRSGLKPFIRFPWRVYEGDPYWVPPLLTEVKAKLDREKNPFFEHAAMELFLARRGEEVTGRIAAIIDENHNRAHTEKVVFFGLYESLDDPETAAALLDAAAAWGAARGMDVLRGPMNLSMNDECAFLAEGFDSPPTIMMPYNPRYYLDLMTACGMAKAKDLFAFRMSRDHVTAAKVAAVVERSQKEFPFTLRSIDMKNLDREAEIVARRLQQRLGEELGVRALDRKRDEAHGEGVEADRRPGPRHLRRARGESGRLRPGAPRLQRDPPGPQRPPVPVRGLQAPPRPEEDQGDARRRLRPDA